MDFCAFCGRRITFHEDSAGNFIRCPEWPDDRDADRELATDPED